MAWTKTACWTDVIGSSTTKTVLAAAASTSGCLVCGDYIVMATQVYYSASTAASYLQMDWFGVNHLGASLADTISMQSVQLTGVNGASVKGTYQTNIAAVDGMRIKAKNHEDTDSASIYVSVLLGTA